MKVACLLVLLVVACRDREAPVPPPGNPELPAWFGRPDAPAQRIAGRVLDGETPRAATVYLSLDVPDARVWSGREVKAGPDGRFDFGLLRPGTYDVYATAPGLISRLVGVDTRRTSASELGIYGYPCVASTIKVETGRSASDGSVIEDPVGGAEIERGGRPLGKTRADGTLNLSCVSSEGTLVTIRKQGFGSQSEVIGRTAKVWLRGPSMPLRGRVVREDRTPVVGAAVQPFYNLHASHTEPFPSPTQAVTDANGRFVIDDFWDDASLRDTDMGVERTELRVFDRELDVGPLRVAVTGHSPLEVEVVIASTGTPPRAAEPVVRVRVTGTVLHAGKPVADAAVSIGGEHVRSHVDGTFELHPPAGSSRVWATHPSGLNCARQIQLRPAEPVTGLVIDLRPRGWVEAQVVDARGQSLHGRGVALTARDSARHIQFWLDKDGRFAIPVETGHTYDLELTDVEPGHLRLGTVTVDLETQAKVSGLRLVVREPEIIGHAVDVRGAPIAGARVVTSDRGWTPPTWVPVGAEESNLAAHATTDAAGRYAWTAQYHGPHSVLVIANDGRVGAIDNVDVTDPPRRITLERPGRITIACTTGLRADHDPVIRRGGWEITAACGTTIGQLPAGRYVVSAWGLLWTATAEVDLEPGASAKAMLSAKPHGTVRGKLVSYPQRVPLAGFKCRAASEDGDDRVIGHDVETAADGTFVLSNSGGRVVVRCEDPFDVFAEGIAHVELGTSAAVTVRMVRPAVDPVDVGVAIRPTPDGARLTRVWRFAAASGLRAGDLVREINGVSLAGLGEASMHALAFQVPSKQATTWTVERAGAWLAISLRW